MESLKIKKYLLSKNIPPHIKGFNYMAEGIRICQNDKNYLHNLTTKLYPLIAKTYGDTFTRTERALRTTLTYLDNDFTIGSFIGFALIELEELETKRSKKK